MRILFITSTRIGDAVLSSGLLAMLLDRYPQAQFTIACGPLAGPLFAEMPRLERIIAIRKQRYLRHWFDFWKEVVLTRWAYVFDLRASFIGQALIARRRKVIRTSPNTSVHMVRQLGVQVGLIMPPEPRLWIAASHERTAEALIPAGPPVVGLGAGAAWMGKRWPAERFAELAHALRARIPDLRFAVYGVEAEREWLQPLLCGTKTLPVIDLIGKTDLLTAYAALKRTQLFIGNDSGLMHLAATAGCPTLGLFGPSREQIYAPWGEHCAAIRTPESYESLTRSPGFSLNGQRSYMSTLEVPMVLDAATALWNRTRQRT